MTHEIFSTPMMLTQNVVDKAGLGIGINSFFQIRVFWGVLRCLASSCSRLIRRQVHLNPGNQGQGLNSGFEFPGTALTKCGGQIWKLPSLPEPCLSPGFHEQWGRDSFMVVSKTSLGSCCGISVWWFGAWGTRKKQFCTVSVLYCFYT